MKPSRPWRQRLLFWFAGKLPPCREIARWTSDACERPLSLRERLLIRLHGCICGWCRRYREQLAWMRAEAAQLTRHSADSVAPPQNRLSVQSRERLKQRLRDAVRPPSE